MSSENQHHLPTSTAYDLWSTVYDTDGNVLQQLDDKYIATHLPPLITPGNTIIELGCGTGRNTLKLAELGAHVLAVDNSRGMLDKLEAKILENKDLKDRVEVFVVDLNTFLAVSDGGDEDGFKTAVEEKKNNISGVVSTLVLEHLTLSTFFSVVSNILPPSGWLLLTNMHWEMGAISSAGFNDPTSGKKVKPVSMNHTKDEILAEAEKWGFVVDGGVEEEGIRDLEHAKGFGRRAEKWVGVLMHFGVVFRKV
ncbi:hypothetical protein TWF281_004962 [Arthrobotrys megalospora]